MTLVSKFPNVQVLFHDFSSLCLLDEYLITAVFSETINIVKRIDDLQL